MHKHEPETRQYIDDRIRRVLAIKALRRIGRIVEQIEADDRIARTAACIFVLLFAAITLGLYFIISHTPG